MKNKKLMSIILAGVIANSVVTQAIAIPFNSYVGNFKEDALLSYKLDKDFNGTDTLVDASSDVETIKDLNEGAILVEFETTGTNLNQVLFSMSDTNDVSSNVVVKLYNGKLRYEVNENGKMKLGYTYTSKVLNDGQTHKIMVNNGLRGSELYIDGVKVYNTNAFDQIFNDVTTPNNITIGARKNSENLNGTEFFKGNIAEISIYGTELEQSEGIELTKVDAPVIEKPEDYNRLLELIHAKEDVNIVFTGDSITHGPQHTFGYRSYSEHLNERITSEPVNGEIKPESFVVNTGVSSGMAHDIVNNFDKMVANNNPDVVFTMIGMNDCANVSAADFEENVTEIVRKVREIGAIPVLQTCNIVRGNRANLAEFMQIVRNVSVEEGVVLIDHYKYWEEAYSNDSNITNTWLNDWIHPNQTGHLEMAQLIMRELELDTEDSATYNLTYPLTTEGEYVDENSVYPYPEYTGVEGLSPVVSYKVNKEFYLNNHIEKNEDIEKVADLQEGTIVGRFNLTNSNLAQTLISLSDSKDPSSNVTLSLNQGTMYYEARENGVQLSRVTTSDKRFNDGKWHTIVLTVNESGTKMYIDGEVLIESDETAFFGDMNEADQFNIGRNVHDGGTEWNYNGAISYIDVYSDVLNNEQALALSEKIESDEVGTSLNLDEIKEEIAENSDGVWVFLGDEDTSSNSDTAGYKNFVEYFEERVRWELNGGSMTKRRKFMINSAVDGATSTEILENFDTWARNYNPAVVSLMIGARETISVEEFEDNLRVIVDRIKLMDAIPFLQTPSTKSEDISKYVEVIRKVAKEKSIALIDHYSLWDDIALSQPHVNTSWLNENGDLNYRGHLKVAQKMLKDLNISGGVVAGFDIPYENTSIDEIKEELRALAEKATTLYDNAVEGSGYGEYEVGSKAELKLSIDFSNLELERENSTVAIVKSRIKELETAIEIFEGLVNDTIIYADGDFNEDGIVNIIDLGIASKYYGKNNEDDNWDEYISYDINQDNVIDDYEINFIMNKILNKE